MKRCFKCLCEKPLREFYKHAAMADGHLNKCKECTKNDVAAHRQRNLQQVRQYDRMRASHPHRLAKNRDVSARWRLTNPSRRAAQMALRYAVITGRVIPWPVCELPECNEKPEAHHPNYDAPLSVVWLCSAHHKQAHALAKVAA